MSERLRLVFIFTGAWWNTPAEYGIYLNGNCLDRGDTPGKLLEPVKKIYGPMVDYGWNEIKFRLESKKPEDVLKGPDGSIVRNKYLELKKILINDVGFDQGELLRLGGCLYKDSDVVNPIKNCTIYEPGSFIFRFKSPIAYWALQNMRTDL